MLPESKDIGWACVCLGKSAIPMTWELALGSDTLRKLTNASFLLYSFRVVMKWVR
jgi:hypothetical protein